MKRVFQLLFAFAMVFPASLHASDRFELTVGLSTPGYKEIEDRHAGGLFYYPIPSLSSIDESYNSVLYPVLSGQLDFDLAESGFLKRLDLVGYAGLHLAGYEEINPVNRSRHKETASMLNLLIGIRVNYINKPLFSLYSQLLLGGEIRFNSRYWEVISRKSSNFDYDNTTAVQFTAIGFNFRLGGEDSKIGVMAEFGFGTESSLYEIPILPGVRTGISYKF